MIYVCLVLSILSVLCLVLVFYLLHELYQIVYNHNANVQVSFQSRVPRSNFEEMQKRFQLQIDDLNRLLTKRTKKSFRSW